LQRPFAVFAAIIMVLLAFGVLSTPAAAGPSVTASTMNGGTTAQGNQTGSDTATLSPGGSTGATPLSTSFPAGVISGQNTYVYTYDTSAESFAVVNPQPYSVLNWDATNKRISVTADRRDAGDEMFVRNPVTLDTAADFTVTARWRATVQGNWQYAFPLFLIPASNTQGDAASSIYFLYAGRDNHATPSCNPICNTPYYYMYYKDAGGVLRINTFYEGQTLEVNREYHFLINYDSSIQMLTMEIRDANDASLKLAHYRIGTNANDGFTVGRLGTASDGRSIPCCEPYAVAWVDDVVLTYATGLFRDATQDKGDQATKIGWLSDNFNDNLNEIWTKELGTVTWQSGAMKMNPNAAVHAGTSWYDQRVETRFTFTADGPATMFTRYKDASNYYAIIVSSAGDSVTFQKTVAGSTTTLGSFNPTINLNTAYLLKFVAKGNSFEMWWNGIRMWTGTDASPPSAITGYLRFSTGSTASVNLDDVRVWNTDRGFETKAVQDAGTVNKPLRTQIAGTVDSYNQVHLQVRSSANNVAWGPWTNLKSDVMAGLYYPLPDQDRQRYYQIRAWLSSGVESTPSLTSVTTQVGTPATNPTSNTGFEPWYPYVGGMVNLVSGNLYHRTTDIAFQGKGFTLAIVRSYNSMRATVQGAFGLGWTFNYGQSLTVNPNGSVTGNGPDGSTFLFMAKGTTGGFSPPAGVPDRLVKNADGTYTMWTPDGGSERFSSAGLLLSMADRNGNTLTMTYSTGSPPLLLQVADATGKALSFAYDAHNQITTVTDPTGRTVTYGYTSTVLFTATDPLGFKKQYIYTNGNIAALQQIIDPVGGTTFVNYLANGQQVASLDRQSVNVSTLRTDWQFREYTLAYNTSTTRAVQDARGSWTTLTLDSFGNAMSVNGPPIGCACDPTGNSSSYVWDGEMNQISRADGGGDTWAMSYGFRTNVVGTADPGGNVSWRAWLEANNATNYFVVPSAGTTFRGFTTTYAYDSKGNQLSVTDPGGNVTRTGYDASGFLNKTVSARGYTTWFVYNASGWLVRQVDPRNDVTQYAYDAIGRQTSVTDPMAFVTTRTYDDDSRMTKVTDPLNNFTSYVYNARGDVIKVIDPNAYATQFQINVTLGAKSKIIETGGNSTVFGYDTRGNLVTVTNPRGFTTTYEYDPYNRETSETTPGGNVTRVTYDRSGNVATRTDANGNRTTYAYDKLNRVTKVTYPGSVVVTTQYDEDGNVVQFAGFGYTRTETWDVHGRATSTVDNYGSFTKTQGYQYDADSGRTRLTYSDGSYATYFYNAAGWQTYENQSEGLSWSFGYDMDGRRTTETHPNGAVATTKYDKASRVTNVWTNRSGSGIESFAYTYDRAGNRLSMTEANGSSANYRYDNLYRLLNESYSNGRSIGYTYDADGNRLTSREIKVGGSLVVTTYTYGKEDQVLKAVIAGGATTTYTYDRNGDEKTSVTGSATTTYAYDIENRLTSVTTSSGTTSYAYSADGRRLKRVSGGTTTYFGNDPVSRSRMDDTTEEYTSTGTKTATYLHGIVVDEILGYKTTAWYDYHRDALGSVTRLTDAAGATLSTYRYDAFGAMRSQTGSSNTYGFTSREREATLGLYFNRARYHDTSLGRFISKDPVGPCGGQNLYVYAGGNPVNRIDPSGMYFDGGGGGGGSSWTGPTWDAYCQDQGRMHCGEWWEWAFLFPWTCQHVIKHVECAVHSGRMTQAQYNRVTDCVYLNAGIGAGVCIASIFIGAAIAGIGVVGGVISCGIALIASAIGMCGCFRDACVYDLHL